AGVADRKGASRPAERRFHGPLVVAPITARDNKDLIDLFGTSPIRRRATSFGPLGTDLRSSLEDMTSALVADVLDGKRPPPGQPPTATKSAERSALVLIYGPVRNR